MSDIPQTLTCLPPGSSPGSGLPVAAVLWVLLYLQLTAIADLGIALLGLSRTARLGEAVHFFLYTPPRCSCC